MIVAAVQTSPCQAEPDAIIRHQDLSELSLQPAQQNRKPVPLTVIFIQALSISSSVNDQPVRELVQDQSLITAQSHGHFGIFHNEQATDSPSPQAQARHASRKQRASPAPQLRAARDDLMRSSQSGPPAQ
jgi:hypothetical protein